MTAPTARILSTALLMTVAAAGPAIQRASGQAVIPAHARPQQTLPLDQMSLEELMNVEVTTVSRTPGAYMAVPAAVWVITDADIRRSGATSIPELLRSAPGMQVARIDAGLYSIGVRGFADRLARSMLVLVDGRAVYSPLFAGTYWEAQDVLLDDVARIEVIRGPGGTLWGSNAVNGIINIITKSAGETQGLLVTGATGSTSRAEGAVRYGGALGDDGHVRAYVKGFDRTSEFNTGDVAYDGARTAQAGFRYDGDLAGGRTLTLQGDAYASRVGMFFRETSLAAPYLSTYTRDVPLDGQSLMVLWSGPLASRTDFQAQASYDRTYRDEYPVTETRNTFDVDVQFNHHGLPRQQIVWGAALRETRAEIQTPPTTALPSGPERLISGFVDDRISLAGERLVLSLGVKLEHNEYSGLELQPSGRVAWLPDPTNTVWAAVTRAVRRPSRVERMYATTSILDPSRPTFIRLSPNPDFAPERLLSYEVGYRTRPYDRLYLTLAAFHNEWRDLLSTELDTPFEEPAPAGGTQVIFPVSFRNGIQGTSDGVELVIDARPMPGWRALATYSYLDVSMEKTPGSADITQESRYEGGSPRHQLHIRNSFDLSPRISVDWLLRYVSELPDVEIPAYATSDVRVGWQLTDALEVEAVGRDLHQAHHPEWPGENGGADVEIRRSFYLGFTWRR